MRCPGRFRRAKASTSGPIAVLGTAGLHLTGPDSAGDPWGPRPVPWGGAVARLRASTSARRLVPTGVALLGTDLLCRAALRLSGRRMRAATARVATIVAGTPAAVDLPNMTRGYVAAQARAWELSWRPWELPRIPIRGQERLAAARATGRGIIVSHTHLGPLTGWVPLVRMLHPMLFPQGDWLVEEPKPGYRGYQVEQTRKVLRAAGAQMMHNVGSAPRVHRVLRGGGAVLISMDVPGERRTEFLGKPVDLDDGTARLAARSDALVLPAALMPVGRRWEIEIHEALDPRSFAEPDELHLALSRVHEQLIMRAPENLESPDRLWARATTEGWFRD